MHLEERAKAKRNIVLEFKGLFLEFYQLISLLLFFSFTIDFIREENINGWTCNSPLTAYCHPKPEKCMHAYGIPQSKRLDYRDRDFETNASTRRP
jgi:hypothetical protein